MTVTRCLLLALALAATLLAPAARAEDGPCLRPGTQQEFPQILGPGFTRGPTKSFEAEVPGAGCAVRYSHPSGMWADVYVFTSGNGVIENIPRDPRLLNEFSGAINSIRSGWSERGAIVADIVTVYERRGTHEPVEALSGWVRIDQAQGGTLRSHVLVWSGAGVIWKLRVTFPASDRAASDPAVVALGNALVDLSREAPK